MTEYACHNTSQSQKGGKKGKNKTNKERKNHEEKSFAPHITLKISTEKKPVIYQKGPDNRDINK